MYKLFTILLASLLLAPLSAFAGRDDFQQPIKVDAKSQFGDGKNLMTIFRHDVQISQGSLLINADEVEVSASEDGSIKLFIARGNPASYQQTTDDNTKLQARANEIRYEVSSRTIAFTGSAELIQDTSSVRGDSIIYDMEKEQLLAESTETQQGRVTTVFRPESVKALTEKEETQQDDEDKPQP